MLNPVRVAQKMLFEVSKPRLRLTLSYICELLIADDDDPAFVISAIRDALVEDLVPADLFDGEGEYHGAEYSPSVEGIAKIIRTAFADRSHQGGDHPFDSVIAEIYAEVLSQTGWRRTSTIDAVTEVFLPVPAVER